MNEKWKREKPTGIIMQLAAEMCTVKKIKNEKTQRLNAAARTAAAFNDAIIALHTLCKYISHIHLHWLHDDCFDSFIAPSSSSSALMCVIHLLRISPEAQNIVCTVAHLTNA